MMLVRPPPPHREKRASRCRSASAHAAPAPAAARDKHGARRDADTRSEQADGDQGLRQRGARSRGPARQITTYADD